MLGRCPYTKGESGVLHFPRKRTSGAEQNCTTERHRMGIKVRGALEIRVSQIAGGQKSSCCA